MNMPCYLRVKRLKRTRDSRVVSKVVQMFFNVRIVQKCHRTNAKSIHPFNWLASESAEKKRFDFSDRRLAKCA